jgi:hypothetical protein
MKLYFWKGVSFVGAESTVAKQYCPAAATKDFLACLLE